MINLWLAIPATTAAIAWTSVVTWYWLRARWWEIPVGRNAMTLYILLALNFIRLAIFSWLVPYDHLRLDQVGTGFVTYTVSAYVGFRALHLIEDAQSAHPPYNRRKDDPKN
jgi:hypothetical protein